MSLINREELLNAFGLSEKTRKYGGDHSGYDTRMLYEIQDTIEDAAEVEAITVDWIVNFKNSIKAGTLMDPREVIKFMLEAWEGDSDAEIQNDKN